MPQKDLKAVLKAYPLSDADLQVILNPDTKIHKYDALYRVRHIDELLDHLGRCILLYLTENERTGHWVALIKKGHTMEFFDPYGYFPDSQGANLGTPEHINDAFGQNHPRFLELVGNAGYDLRYNDEPLQKEAFDIATCGRHTATRLIFYKLDLPQYHRLMKELSSAEHKDADDVVTQLTYEIIQK